MNTRVLWPGLPGLVDLAIFQPATGPGIINADVFVSGFDWWMVGCCGFDFQSTVTGPSRSTLSIFPDSGGKLQVVSLHECPVGGRVSAFFGRYSVVDFPGNGLASVDIPQWVIAGDGEVSMAQEFSGAPDQIFEPFFYIVGRLSGTAGR